MINNSSTKLGENEALYTTGTFSGGSVSLKKLWQVERIMCMY